MAGRVVAKDCTLTRAGQKLVDVLLDPRSENMTALQRAQAAGISLRRYHQLMADPDFQAALKAKAIEMLMPSIPKVLEVAKQTAQEPGRDGFKDREMLLRLVQWYDPKSTVEHTGPGGEALRIVIEAPQSFEGE